MLKVAGGLDGDLASPSQHCLPWKAHAADERLEPRIGAKSPIHRVRHVRVPQPANGVRAPALQGGHPDLFRERVVVFAYFRVRIAQPLVD